MAKSKLPIKFCSKSSAGWFTMSSGDFLPLMLLAYLMSMHTSTQTTPFSLVYGPGNGSR